MLPVAPGRRLRPVYTEPAPSRLRGGPVALNANAVIGSFAGTAKSLPSLSHAGGLVAVNTNAVIGSFAGPAKSNAGGPVALNANAVIGSFAGTAKSLPSLSHAGGPVVLNANAVIGSFAGTAKSLPSLSHAGGAFACRHAKSFQSKSNADLIVEQLAHKVEIGDNLDFKERFSVEEKRVCSNMLAFEDRYYNFVKPLLSSRCLIAPAGLNHPSTVFLHRQTYKILKLHPRYLSVFDIMSFEDGVRATSDWILFLDHLAKNRLYVIEDKDMKQSILSKDKNKKQSISSIQTLVYDHGVKGVDDGIDVYKGECDASVVKKLLKKSACLSYIIWKGDTVVFSEIYRDISCDTVTEAEVYAAFALLSKAKDLKILKMQICSDCETVLKILSGELIIDIHHPERDTYLMLRSMRRHFQTLIATWKPRELMAFVDDFAKAEVVAGRVILLKQKWSSHLKGLPLFKIQWTDRTKTAISKFGKTHVDDSYGTSPSSVFFIEVDEKYKIDCLIGLKQSIGRNKLVLYVNDIEGKPLSFIDGLKKIVGNHTEEKFGSYSCLTECCPKDDVKNLVVVLDAVIPEKVYYVDGAFHVLLATPNEVKVINKSTPNEMKLVNGKEIPEFTALGFVYFNGVKYPLNDCKNKETCGQRNGVEDQNLSSVVEGDRLSSVAEGDHL